MMDPDHTQPNLRRVIYHNDNAASWTSRLTDAEAFALAQAREFHHSLPHFSQTPLVALNDVAREIGVKAVYLKDESDRCDLPAFKILGASWAAFRAIAQNLDLPLDSGIDDLAEKARAANIKLFAATDGNHGRAVARFARILGIAAKIWVPSTTEESTIAFIHDEEAEVAVVDGDYDEAVRQARHGSEDSVGALWIQDTAFDDYQVIPQWTVDGYSTMLAEVDEQLCGELPDLVVTPVGVGSFAQAVTTHNKAAGRNKATQVLTVEPERASCLWQNLQTQRLETIATSETIMAGMNCGTVSSLSWPILQSGVDVSLTVSDWEAHRAVEYLQSLGVSAGPCGAATLAGLRRAVKDSGEIMGLGIDSVVVLYCTEGSRIYKIPQEHHV